ncbi:MAG: TIGR04222 domain-containing membrane protein [Rhodocyclaceae bacterium]|nr:TIGR04222 domain-containing membrane protein [Rhodocyclaceae bacterium]MBX3667456.1 TIGR04222 domain-containing membrane protein [Rhodocyclaceae bacterium]
MTTITTLNADHPQSARAGELWQQLRNWSPDHPADALPFSLKLQHENRWSAAHTLRVIDEYRRFVLLAQVAGHTVTPSDAVDQVWHLHMLHSCDYWQEFCPKLLGNPLHHEPSRGGSTQLSHYREGYRRTLESYERLFGESAPADIWPAPDERFGGRYRRVDMRRVWLLPRPRLPRSWHAGLAGARLLPAAIVALLSGGCARLVDSSQPGSPPGPQFLVIYLGLLLLAIGAARALRRLATGAASTPRPRGIKPDIYELAYLAGATARVRETAFGRLYQQGCIEFTGAGAGCTVLSAPPREAHAVEHACYHHARAQGNAVGKVAGLDAAVRQLRDGLIERGLSPDAAQARAARGLSMLPLAALFGLGLLRHHHGTLQGKPVAFLTLLLVLTAVAALLCLRRPRSTADGRRALAQARANISRRRKRGRTDQSMPLAIALFGTAVLADNSMADFKQAIRPDRGGGGGSDGGSGCGGGGCGGCGG